MGMFGLTISCLIYHKCSEEEVELIRRKCIEGCSWEEAMRSAGKEYDPNWLEKLRIENLNRS